ncbi:hypothetical protein [Levilactobacillus yonginensis]|uniref:hypothetical protein n=1 Tax=Levilactobacillus yonginensis TaxID=1054041 RepID=UPI000F76B2A4|nr:hypothetical protein [Levilactobacillus yonginensis]
MRQTLTPFELRAVIKQTAAYRNARAILAGEWAARAEENPLFQAPITVADLTFARDLQAVDLAAGGLDFNDYGSVQKWIAANRQSLTADDVAWLHQDFD